MGLTRRLSATAAFLTALAALNLAPFPTAATAAPNAFEERKIEAQALEAFRRMLTLWREEVYFELYDQGMEASKARISRENFAQRMVQLEWLPQGDPAPRYLSANYRFRTLTYVKVRVLYRNKFNPSQQFSKDQSFLLTQEQGAWKVDLVDLIRSPYGS
jgi:hypothetical protein